MEAEAPPAKNSFPCGECGAYLEYEVGATHMYCEYCGNEVKIEVDDTVSLPTHFRSSSPTRPVRISSGKS